MFTIQNYEFHSQKRSKWHIRGPSIPRSWQPEALQNHKKLACCLVERQDGIGNKMQDKAPSSFKQQRIQIYTPLFQPLPQKVFSSKSVSCQALLQNSKHMVVQGICASVRGMRFPIKQHMHIRQKWLKRTNIALVYHLFT